MMILTRVFGFVSVAFIVCGVTPFHAEAQTGTPKKGADVTRIGEQYVCMVTDKAFDKKQIPVRVHGDTYYGCCQGCVNRLHRDPSIRTAIDPVSRDTVDKATAIVGVGPDGQVYYFESETNMQAFDPPSSDGDTQHQEND